MHRKTVVRSIISSSGSCFAYSDNTISWKTNSGFVSSNRLPTQTSVILGTKNANGELGKLILGGNNGRVYVMSLPNLNVIDEFDVGQSRIRCLTIVDDVGKRFLAGMENGEVWNLGEKVPNRKIKLFSIGGPISSLAVVNDTILCQQGWTRRIFDWEGNERNSIKENEAYRPKYSQRIISPTAPKIRAIM